MTTSLFHLYLLTLAAMFHTSFAWMIQYSSFTSKRVHHRSTSSLSSLSFRHPITISMKVSKGKSKLSRSKGSTIALKNEQRLSVAGRRGTKNFLDPNKLFVGNLPFSSNENDLKSFLNECGIPNDHIYSIKIIRDWKTNESKGYGFVQFTEPIFATSAMEFVKGKKLQGRVLRLDQGVKKRPDQIVVVKDGSKSSALDDEDSIIQEGINQAELESDVYVDSFDQYDDDELFPDDDDDDGFEFDGVYEEEYLLNDDQDGDDENKPMNREQRREAARKNKGKKKPAKGFGNL